MYGRKFKNLQDIFLSSTVPTAQSLDYIFKNTQIDNTFFFFALATR